MNPYTVLGVDKQATPAEIKAVYRKLSMKHHPDKGGDPEIFSPIADAWACLSNPEKRAEYDETGVMPVDMEAAIRSEALAILGRMVSETLDQMVRANMDHHRGDFVKAMKEFIQKKMGENQADLEQTELADRLYADTLAKMFIKKPDEFEGADVFTGVIKTKREENDQKQFAIGNGLKVLSRCLELLELYGFNLPQQIESLEGIRQTLTIGIRMGEIGGWSGGVFYTETP